MEHSRPCVVVLDPQPAGLATTAAMLQAVGAFSVNARTGIDGGDHGLDEADAVLVAHRPPLLDALGLGSELRHRRPALATILVADVLDHQLRCRAVLSGFDELLPRGLESTAAALTIGHALRSAARRSSPRARDDLRRGRLLDLAAIGLQVEMCARDLQASLAVYRLADPSTEGLLAASRAADAAQRAAHASLAIHRRSLELVRSDRPEPTRPSTPRELPAEACLAEPRV